MIAKHGSYYEWTKRKEFQVGDSLMFEYDGNVNDVTQVSSRLEYQFCNSLSPKAFYNTGHDVVTLTEPVDDVLEINSDLEFKSCDTISPVALHNAGQDLIRLTKPGIRYFITSKIGHCEAGLKLRVVVRPLSKSVPKKMQLSPFDRFIKWLRDSFTPHPHH
ncbi:hypothetical protein HID58_076447 [Brassica napus]|uniref:Phytocyanin domain-containing protein n=1 Tax=Brassica napus TaxID=3708 RepID=A0ABQ7YMH7_BRANA|nr:hypothetical protein HID58_076447 [Brassica napus]